MHKIKIYFSVCIIFGVTACGYFNSQQFAAIEVPQDSAIEEVVKTKYREDFPQSPLNDDRSVVFQMETEKYSCFFVSQEPDDFFVIYEAVGTPFYCFSRTSGDFVMRI